jgi:hypothetical protein
MNGKREPQGRVNRLPGMTSASLSGRRRLWGSNTRAFSPGFNMTGLRPFRIEAETVAGEVRALQRRAGTQLNPSGGGQKVGTFRTGTMGKRVEVGKGGQKLAKRTGFSHFQTASTRLFPRDSTQVVDFPHLVMVGLFWEQGFYRRDAETPRQEEERGTMHNDYRHNGRNGRAKPIRRIRILVAIIGQNRAAKCA